MKRIPQSNTLLYKLDELSTVQCKMKDLTPLIGTADGGIKKTTGSYPTADLEGGVD